MNAQKLLDKIDAESAKQKTMVQTFVTYFGDYDHMTVDNGNRIELHCYGNWIGLLRRLRRAGAGRITKRSLFPWTLDGKGATLSIHLTLRDIPITVYASVDDYTRFLKPGSTCHVAPLSNHVVCK